MKEIDYVENGMWATVMDPEGRRRTTKGSLLLTMNHQRTIKMHSSG